MHLLIASEEVYGLAKIAEFYEKGGYIMYALTLCSIITVAVIVFKALDLARQRILPPELKSIVENFSAENEAAAERVVNEANAGASVLARLIQVVMKRQANSPDKIRDAVQAKAHEEIVKLQSGIGVLEVVIVVSPLLGLLGTASGITTVFDGLSSLDEIKNTIMAAGVAEALSTTIAGLAVAVPAVIGHSYFNRRIEKYAAQLEVAVDDLVHAVSDQSTPPPVPSVQA